MTFSYAHSSPLLPAPAMDISDLAWKLGLLDSKPLVRKAEELRRLCDVRIDASVFGIGEVCKAIICLEIAANRLQILFQRLDAIRLSGVSEKAYNRSFNSMQNCLGVKTHVDVRELAIQFGCVRLVPIVQNGFSLYKQRFLYSLPAARRASTDFGRPVFIAVAFYFCARKHKLKVDKQKLIELCGSSESEFSNVSTSMNDLCFDVFGVSKEKKDPKAVKGHRELLDALPCKRSLVDGGDLSDDYLEADEDGLEIPSYKRQKKIEKATYEDWKSKVIVSNQSNKIDSSKTQKQTRLNFAKKTSEPVIVQAS